MRKVSKAVYKFRRGHQRTLTKSQRSPLKRSNAVIIEIASHAKKKKERKKTTHTKKEDSINSHIHFAASANKSGLGLKPERRATVEKTEDRAV